MTTNYQYDAFSAQESLRDTYIRYLLEATRLHGGPLHEAAETLWREPGREGLFAPTLVEGAFGFRPDKRPAEIEPLHPRTVQLLEAAGIDYTLYDHQVAAIDAAHHGRTVVLAAGTGSGKTEAFLIPLINRMYWDHENGLDDLGQPGIRAVVVYPLNALINNQIQRLAELLGSQQEISFAYYTSRLKETFKQAKSFYEGYDRPMPPPCQVIDRQTLRGLGKPQSGRAFGPPHILVTNFTMLEYMLVRPIDRTLFMPNYAQFEGRPRLRQVVLDEAHVYAGAQAAEIHLLLRRVAHRFGTTLAETQGYATSATLGDGAHDALVEFVARMFSKSHDKVAAIHGKRWLAPVAQRVDTPPKLALPAQVPELLRHVRTLQVAPDGRITGLLADADAVAKLADLCDKFGLTVPAERDATPARFLHDVCVASPTLVALREWIYERPQLPTLGEVAEQLFDTTEQHAERAAYLALWLASLARPTASSPAFIPTRLHQFMRAPTGLRIQLPEEQHPPEQWWKHTVVSAAQDESWEVNICASCGAPYGIAHVLADNWGDETFHATPSEGTKPLAFVPGDDPAFSIAGHPLRRVELAADGVTLTCLSCGGVNVKLTPVRFTGQQTIGVIIDALYEHLGAFPSGESLPAEGRRLLTFSDSRQEAARVAAQVEYSHDRGLNRQIILRRMKSLQHCTVRELIEALAADPLLRSRAVFARVPSARHDELCADVALLGVFDEFSRPPARGFNLETLGLTEVDYPHLPAAPEGLPAQLDTATWRDMMRVVLDDLRRRIAVQRPQFETDNLAVNLYDFLPRLDRRAVESTHSEDDDSDSDGNDGYAEKTIGFLPRSGSSNRISRWLTRVLPVVCPGANVDVTEVLRAMWRQLLELAADPRIRWLVNTGEAQLQIKLERLSLRYHAQPKYWDGVTRQAHHRSVGGVSPDSDVALTAVIGDNIETWRTLHSVRRARAEPLAMWSLEHTAQIETEDLADMEEEFRRGARNLLACSTTLEMGVDLGGLTSVIMANVPPGPANYWQRAGRAGRRADGSSSVLTIARDQPHDQLAMHDPRAFLHRKITPPRVRLDGDPLVQRHVNSFLLSYFFDHNVELASGGNPMKAYGDVESFFLTTEEAAECMAERFVAWLAETTVSLRWLVSSCGLEPHTDETLRANCAETMRRCITRVTEDVELVDAMLAENEQLGAGLTDKALATALGIQKRTLLRTHLITFLATRSFLPRFGFPLEVVQLDTRWNEQRGSALRMERTLDIALAEYAPGAAVIAGKQLHRSAGVQRNWFDAANVSVKHRVVVECRNCGHMEDHNAQPKSCSVCAAEVLGVGDLVGRKSDDLKEVATAHHFLEPTGFAVKFGKRPREITDRTSRNKLAGVATSLLMTKTAERDVGDFKLRYAEGSRVFVRAGGRTSAQPFGFAICQRCGLAAAEADYGGKLPQELRDHQHLRGRRNCKANTDTIWRNRVLGISLPVDALAVDLPEHAAREAGIVATFATCLQIVAAEMMELDPRSLRSDVVRYGQGSGHAYRAAIYEEGESGFLRMLFEQPEELVERTLDFIFSDDVDVVRFDNQWLVTSGQLDITKAREVFREYRDPA